MNTFAGIESFLSAFASLVSTVRRRSGDHVITQVDGTPKVTNNRQHTFLGTWGHIEIGPQTTGGLARQVLRTVHSLRRIRLRQWLRLSALAVGLALMTCLVPLIHQLMTLVRAVVIWVM